ncbi:MAG: tagatose-bisphosphate aldolase [Miniphocaeibacter sp.]|uniref:tagatose-bisphosphate aldolase n=1 Tax=Miniphocaeibacter sp. TaxID=3100973 RepID=UPI0017AC2AA0|nr:tagatose-bisphosphate aldolase [Gallicola sp.]
MKKLTPNKKEALLRLSNSNNIIAALAIDQRGAIRKMMGKIDPEKATKEMIVDFKIAVSRELTKYSSSILLDPEYGLPASKERDENAGLLIAYEKTGYDANAVGRLPDLLPIWSVKRIKEQGADAVKILLYYDIDEGDEINEQKHAFIERVGSECVGEDIPFFLEIISYDANIEDSKSKEYAKIKPHKVNDAMRLFSQDRYNVDVLKMEVPVNMDYVEGYGEDFVYTREEALKYFKEQSEASHLPFIFLSAGVSAEMFQETLRFAKEAGSTFNGVLCGRATWAKGVDAFMESEEKGYTWLKTEGKKNIEDLNKVIEETASPWTSKLD